MSDRESEKNDLTTRFIKAASGIPFLLRIALIAPALLSSLTLVMGLVGLTAYTAFSGFNFLKFMSVYDILTVGTSMMLYWFGPFLVIAAAGALLFVAPNSKSTPETKSDQNITNNSVQSMYTQAQNTIKKLCFIMLLLIVTTIGLSLISSTTELGDIDGFGIKENSTSNRYYGEIYLNASTFIVLKTGQKFYYYPEIYYAEEGVGTSGPVLKSEWLVVKRKDIGLEFSYISAEGDSTFFEHANFRGSDARVSLAARLIKAPFR